MKHLLVAALITTTLVVAPAHAEEPTRVLIVGDSITQGYDGDHTWRYFAAQQVSGVDLVGNRTGTFVDGTDTAWDGTYADPDFDSDHAARWGLSMWETLYQPGPDAPPIGELVAAHQPDVVVNALGTNGLAWFDFSTEKMGQQVRTFVAQARTADPEVDVVLLPVPATWVRRAIDYNATLPALADELSADRSHVVVAPVVDYVQGVDTTDAVHPNDQGQRKLAASVVEALSVLAERTATDSVAPTPSPTPTPIPTPAPTPTPVPVPAPLQPPEVAPAPAPTVVPPAAPRRVRAVRRGRRVRVGWRRTRRADRYVVRCGAKARLTVRASVSMRARARRCKVRAVNEGGASPWRRTLVRRHA